MREIKFRGLDKNGVWYYGYLVYIDMSMQIQVVYNVSPTMEYPCGDQVTEYYTVDPKTVGQYAECKDKNYADIYEDDIVRFPRIYDNPEDGLGSHEFMLVKMLEGDTYLGGCHLNEYKQEELEIIGNKYENPGLLTHATEQVDDTT